MDHPGVQVVVAHEPLDAERGLVALVAEVLGDPGLEVAPEHVVLVAREEVQLVADAPEKGQRRVGRRLLARRDEPLVGQLAERARSNFAAPSHIAVWMSRSPPADSLTFGSPM